MSQNHDIPTHMYADDAQLMLSFEPNNSDIATTTTN